MIIQCFEDQTLLSIFSGISYKFSVDGYIKEGILDVPCSHCISFFTFLWTGLVLLWACLAFQVKLRKKSTFSPLAQQMSILIDEKKMFKLPQKESKYCFCQAN